MTRQSPSRLQETAKSAKSESRARAREEHLSRKSNKERKIAYASAAEKDRVWSVLVTAAINNIPIAYFDRLNIREKNFLIQLGFFREPENSELEPSWRDVHLSRYKSELDALDRQINEIERTDPFSEALPRLSEYRTQIAREVFSLQPNESPFKSQKKEKPPRIRYEIKITDPVSKGKHFEEYDISWLFWLLREGQSFFVRLEKKLELTAKLGESYEVFIANPSDGDSQLSSENFEPGRRYERAWISSDKFSDNSHHVGGDPPGLPYDYFSDEEVIARRGPDPDMLRYFLELLGYQCTLRTKKGESILKIKWA